MSRGEMIRPVRLPQASINALADLVSAGYGVSGALAALPTRSLPRRTRTVVETHVAALRAGARADRILDQLGLEITSAAMRGQRRSAADLERAMRADAESRVALDASQRSVRTRVQGFGLFVLVLTLLALFLALVILPNQIAGLSADLPEGAEMPETLARFEEFRNRWLMVGVMLLLAPLGLCLLYAGWLGRERLSAFLHELRLYVPFLRSHAFNSCRARLLEALLFEQSAGIAANETVRRVAQREPVPSLREILVLAATRLDAGDPFKTCLRETPLETDLIADLTSVAGRGARPAQGWRLAAGIHRETATRSLRRGVVAAAVLILVPTFLYTAVLLQAAVVSSTVAQLRGVQVEMDRTVGNIRESMGLEEDR